MLIPPIKCQGIKSKLIPWIEFVASESKKSFYFEPFLGSGVVAFNLAPERCILSDTNPHIIAFYNSIKAGKVTPENASNFLKAEGKILEESHGEHFYVVRERFNETHSPFDFLFLSRACFNGVMRFNRKGGFNTPFCRKPERFAQAYITKIRNQIAKVQDTLKNRPKWEFRVARFSEIIPLAGQGDLIYCDPPYIGRHVNYFDSWNESFERELFSLLDETKARFILSTWHSNDFRKNEFIDTLWSKFEIKTREHFYHVGACEDNRNPMLEALIINFESPQCDRPMLPTEKTNFVEQNSPRTQSTVLKEQNL